MSLCVTVVDEQTGERLTRRIATGDYAVVSAHPCIVDKSFTDIKNKRVTIYVKDFNPQSLPQLKKGGK